MLPAMAGRALLPRKSKLLRPHKFTMLMSDLERRAARELALASGLSNVSDYLRQHILHEYAAMERKREREGQ